MVSVVNFTNTFPEDTGIWRTDMPFVTNGISHTSTSKQNDGVASYYSFEAYTPKSTEYDGSKTKKILIQVKQLIVPAPEEKTRDNSGFKPPVLPDVTYLTWSDKGPRLVSKDDINKYGGHFGVIGSTSKHGHPCVILAYHSSVDSKNSYGDSYAAVTPTLMCETFLFSIAKLGDDFVVIYDPATMMLVSGEDSYIAKQKTISDSNADWLEKAEWALPWETLVWELYVPANDKGSLDKDGGSMFEYNRDDALKTYLLNRCMGVTTEACRTSETKCTQFFSDGSLGKNCNEAAKLSDYAKQAAYKAVCGIQPDGDKMGQPFANLSPFRDALSTVDCSCINYKNSSFTQPNLVGRDYTRFVQDFPQIDIPDEAYCWWPSCTNASRSLTVTSQRGPTDSSLYDPKCPAIVNNMKRISEGLDPLAPGDEGFTPSSVGPGSITPASGEPGPETGNPGSGDAGNAESPSFNPAADAKKPKPWYSQPWFIATASILVFFIVLGLYYWSTKTAAKPTVVPRKDPIQITTRRRV
jgi:hypothetical protein